MPRIQKLPPRYSPVRGVRMTKTQWRSICRAARRLDQRPSDFIRKALEQRVARVLRSKASSASLTIDPQRAEVAS